MPSKICYLVYTSIASRLLNDNDLFELLEQSRRNNLVFGLTGMLLYMEGTFIAKTQGRFIQVLEGQKSSVQHIYDKICGDKRNESILLLSSGASCERNFSKWSMGFSTKNTTFYDNTTEFFNLDNGFFALDHINDPCGSNRLLSSFYNINSGE